MEKTVTLKSGRQVKIKPLTIDLMLEIARKAVKEALVRRENMAVLSESEILELFNSVAAYTAMYWKEKAQLFLQGEP